MTNIRLTDMQLVLLSTAADRKDGSLMPLPASIGDQAARAAKAVEQLIKKGLAEEKPTTRKNAIWREDGETRIGAVITDAGRAAINAEEQAEPGEHEQPAPELQPEPAPRATKRNLLIEMLKREGGATLDQMVEATGWLPHTTRAAMTGLRKAGMTLDSDKVDGVRHYRIVETN
ncbi:DUF3489 domain-containing protein [Sphingosinicella microcystinivorans]|uniref:DUF3489 domain-containing protein n=1 Tax=Sphingosinicella microcystinivorans TaxID=335406 RepID=UPI0022F3ECB6|nr:DUF3489 domain-containing protein [Sphingosinicella microcystinivorans]WBX86316.1 DUF3489 domain-containing protein [Sphingosinicella microcystinivorans]